MFLSRQVLGNNNNGGNKHKKPKEAMNESVMNVAAAATSAAAASSVPTVVTAAPSATSDTTVAADDPATHTDFPVTTTTTGGVVATTDTATTTDVVATIDTGTMQLAKQSPKLGEFNKKLHDLITEYGLSKTEVLASIDLIFPVSTTSQSTTFPERLHSLLGYCTSTEPTVAFWDSCGTSFTIELQDRFMALWHQHTKGSDKFTTFTRQLKYYEFQKGKDCTWTHVHFTKGGSRLEMVTRPAKKSKKNEANHVDHNTLLDSNNNVMDTSDDPMIPPALPTPGTAEVSGTAYPKYQLDSFFHDSFGSFGAEAIVEQHPTINDQQPTIEGTDNFMSDDLAFITFRRQGTIPYNAPGW